jgi:putative transposase
MPRRKDPRIPDAVLDQLLAGADPKTVFDPNGLLDDLKKALAERVLNAEMDHHLAGEEPATGEMVMARRRSLPIPDRSS